MRLTGFKQPSARRATCSTTRPRATACAASACGSRRVPVHLLGQLEQQRANLARDLRREHNALARDCHDDARPDAGLDAVDGHADLADADVQVDLLAGLGAHDFALPMRASAGCGRFAIAATAWGEYISASISSYSVMPIAMMALYRASHARRAKNRHHGGRGPSASSCSSRWAQRLTLILPITTAPRS